MFATKRPELYSKRRCCSDRELNDGDNAVRGSARPLRLGVAPGTAAKVSGKRQDDFPPVIPIHE